MTRVTDEEDVPTYEMPTENDEPADDEPAEEIEIVFSESDGEGKVGVPATRKRRHLALLIAVIAVIVVVGFGFAHLYNSYGTAPALEEQQVLADAQDVGFNPSDYVDGKLASNEGFGHLSTTVDGELGEQRDTSVFTKRLTGEAVMKYATATSVYENNYYRVTANQELEYTLGSDGLWHMTRAVEPEVTVETLMGLDPYKLMSRIPQMVRDYSADAAAYYTDPQVTLETNDQNKGGGAIVYTITQKSSDITTRSAKVTVNTSWVDGAWEARITSMTENASVQLPSNLYRFDDILNNEE